MGLHVQAAGVPETTMSSTSPTGARNIRFNQDGAPPHQQTNVTGQTARAPSNEYMLVTQSMSHPAQPATQGPLSLYSFSPLQSPGLQPANYSTPYLAQQVTSQQVMASPPPLMTSQQVMAQPPLATSQHVMASQPQQVMRSPPLATSPQVMTWSPSVTSQQPPPPGHDAMTAYGSGLWAHDGGRLHQYSTVPPSHALPTPGEAPPLAFQYGQHAPLPLRPEAMIATSVEQCNVFSQQYHGKVPGDGKKCRRVYGMERKGEWCSQCKWKKACVRFID